MPFDRTKLLLCASLTGHSWHQGVVAAPTGGSVGSSLPLMTVAMFLALVDSRGENGHSLYLVSSDGRGGHPLTVGQNVKDHLCSIIPWPIRWQEYDTVQMILGILGHRQRVSSSPAPVAGI